MSKKMEKGMAKILCILMLSFTIFSNITIESFAAVSGTLDVDTNVGWSFGGTSWGQAGLMKINGKVVYCLEPLVNYVGGSVYDPSTDFSELGISTDTVKKLSLISYFAKQRATSTGNRDWYSIGASAIWAELGHPQGWIESQTFSNEGQVKSAINQLLSDVNNYYIRPSFHNNTKTIKVGETIRLTDTNGVLNTYTIKSQDGLNARIEGNDLVVTGTESANDLSSIVLVKKISSEDTGTSILYRSGNLQKVGSFYIEDPIRSFLKFNVEKYGNLEIAKKDNKGNFVPNTEFNVSYNSDMSNPIGTFTTGENGKVTVSGLNPTTVYIQEISVPEHLVLDSTIHSVTITPNSTVSYVATNNFKQAYIQVVKKDSKTGEIIKKAGTEFEILKGENVVETIVTNDEGKAKSGLLDYSIYTIREKLSPENFVITDITQSANLTENGKTYEFEFYNEPVVGEIILNKEDTETGSIAQGDGTLRNAEYVLKANEPILNPADGSILYEKDEVISVKNVGQGTWGDVGTKNIDENLKIKWSNLPMGQYSIEETNPSEGYLIDETKHIVNLTSVDQTTKVVVSNQISKEQVIKGQLEIFKTGNDGSVGVVNGLEGVEFTMKLYSEVQNVGWDNATTGDVLLTNKDGRAVSKKLPYGLYLVKETNTPENYYPAGDFFVMIDEDNEIEYRLVNNAPFKSWLKLVKTDSEGNSVVLSNATFKLKDENGNYVKQKVGLFNKDEWKTDKNGIAVLDDMVLFGTYYIEEIKNPDGFLITEPIEVEITSNNPTIEMDEDNNPIITVEIKNDKPVGKIILNKSTEIPTDITKKGIKFRLTANSDIINATDGTILYKKGDIITKDNEDGIYEVNENGKLEILNLPLGIDKVSYKLDEVQTIDGYKLLDEPIIFDFEIVDNTTKEYVVEKSVENKLTETYFSKVDIGGEEVEGAKVQIIDKETGEIVEEWISTKEPHIVKGLVENKEYIFHEEIAPNGLVIANDIEFTVNGENQHIEMVDKKVSIAKVDVNGEIVEGAKLQVIDKETNKVVDEWTSTKEPHDVNNLVVGKTYILHEEVAPNGLVIAKDVEFTVEDDNQNQYIEMVDKQVEIIKTDLENGELLAGAELVITDKETGEEVDKTITTLNAWNPNNLEEGKTYILSEPNAPKGYEVAEPIEFTVTSDKEIQKIEMKDKPILTDIEVNKVDSITKEPIKSSDFEFTLYADEECTQVIQVAKGDKETGKAIFEDVRYGVVYVKETKAPKGYQLSDEVKKIVIDDNLEGVGNVHSFVYENILLPAITLPNTGDDSILFTGAIAIITTLAGIGLAIGRRKKCTIKKDM